MKYDVIVVGAGAAGLFAAANISEGTVLVLEKNKNAGRKLLIAGGGKCNFTNLEDRKDLINRYFGKKNFAKPAIFNFPPNELIAYFNRNGLKTVTDEEERVFPESMNGRDVLRMMLNLCRKNGVKMLYSSPVIGIKRENDRFYVTAKKSVYESKFIVIATGGKSYPWTGSEGDGYRFAKMFGHKIVDPEPALTPVKIENRFEELAGITLKRKRVSVYRKGEKIAEIEGNVLFTHNGLSGPAVLNLSRAMNRGDVISISLADFTNKETLLGDVKRKLNENGKKSIVNIIRLYDIPYKLALHVLKAAGVDYGTKAAGMKKNDIIKVAENLFPEYIVNSKYGFKKAMLTSGGVATDEIKSRSMESKLVKGLYFVGEIIDVDGKSGGYNLQFAFSSGKLVADDINRKIQDDKFNK
ncbi:MAG: aminoacetone oxidase family FAD-binding enzyme [Proteobacteria bacterium]|nr:aminoacetone oxidase family FAD-binding enzyme [Pseudomonadota bacterium]